MANSDENQKEMLLDRICAILSGRMSARRAKMAKIYTRQYFRRVPMEDIRHEDPEQLATIASNQLDFINRRKPGERLFRVFNPSVEIDGWESNHTVIEMVNDDQPFLVGTATLALSEMDLGVHLIIHPVIPVSRDAKGVLTAIHARNGKGRRAESMMQIQVDRQTKPAVLDRIESRLTSALEDAGVAVADWKAMDARAAETIGRMPEWAPRTDAELLRECRDFIRWTRDDHFVFLGARDYEVVKGKRGFEVQIVPGSGLGILRETDKTVGSRPMSSLAEAARKRSHKVPLIVTKTNARSTVHRVGYLDYIGVLKTDARGRTIGERRFVGLFTSNAYSLGVRDTPLVRVKVRNVLDASGMMPGSHAWKSMMHIMETLPRDDMFQATSGELQEIAVGVLNLQERSRVRLFIRRERYGRFYSCLVYIPRERFNTENREKIQAILKRALKGKHLDYVVNVSESALARLQVIVRPKPGQEVSPDVPALEQKIVEAVRSWRDQLTSIMVQKFGEELGLRYAASFGKAFPEAYKEDVSPWVAAFDVENAAALDGGNDLRMSLYRPRKRRTGIIRFKVFRLREPIPLSDVLPMLENLGLRIVSERPYELRFKDDSRLWIQDFDMIPSVERDLDLEVIRDLFQEAFERTLRGYTESDGLNRLVIAAQLHWRQVKMLRAYCKYLLQTGIPFSLIYMAETLAKHPPIARLLVELFEAIFDPRRDGESARLREAGRRQLAKGFESLLVGEHAGDKVLLEYVEDMVAARKKDRGTQITAIDKAFRRSLASVASLDEDRILHAFYDAIRATLRTNYFQSEGSGESSEYISFKLDSGRLPDLPLPRPYREIWVYSPRFEGIHLRGGKIARGGLRWSDRREDFRTEVLGLMKAQNVKNTMIVPVGAKGGFVVKRMPEDGDREAVLKEGVECYSMFINALLDITDNLDEDKVLPPTRVVRRDEDDPYLVVAADKGTATFSDTANGIAQDHGFWLGDAFASGGSAGYDHKGMGITAKGAWEGVKRHFRELGTDIQREPFTVVGIGDMSGDVFGNGMLLSRHIRLKAAFNHLHIFIDPDPDPKTGLRERRRLFRKARSSWADYKPELISAGGGVWSRRDKAIPISPEVGEWLGIEETELPPHRLIRELLKAKVDLLWNGGIGTYVKASAESHADVGDLANNALRVDGSELGCRVIGEGGNLGLTQLGRMEFAAAGGRINTDFIDNSAGVDTSDHEVNIKILLDLAIRAGRLDPGKRNDLLASMTGEVEQLALRSNYLQTQAISMMERLSVPRLGSKAHFISVLEDEGMINRELEQLPDDEALTERRAQGKGMLRPELSVLLSYSKIMLYRQLLESDVPEDVYLSGELVRYFPTPLQQQFEDLTGGHRLRREIIATQVTNSLVNRMGASFTLRMQEDTGATPGEVAKAYTIAREVFEARRFWSHVESLDNKVGAELQIAAMLRMWELIRQATRWLLNVPGDGLNIQFMVDRLASGFRILANSRRKTMTADEKAAAQRRMEPFIEGGFSRRLAFWTVMLEQMFPVLEVVETAARRNTDVEKVATAFFGLGDKMGLTMLREQVESLHVQGQWHAQARANLRDELFAQHNRLVERVLQTSGRKKDPVADWIGRNEEKVRGVTDMLEDMQQEPAMDYATIAVAVRSLKRLVRATAPERSGEP